MTKLWLNGRYQDQDQAGLSPLDRGLLYGDGLFETLRSQGGRVFHLERHLARLGASAAELGLAMPEQMDWQGVIAELLAQNQVSGPGRVKLLITRGSAPGLGLPQGRAGSVMVTAESYTPPGEAVYGKGIALSIARRVSAPPLARHKTLNYLPYLAARQEALDLGYNEAAILSPQGEVCEASAAAIMGFSGSDWWTPSSPLCLPSITLELVSGFMAQGGRPVRPRGIRPGDLMAAETLWLLNSLQGVMPVSRVGDRVLPRRRAALAAEMRARLFALA